MNPSRFLLSSIALALALLFTLAVPAAAAAAKKSAPPEDKRILIKSVDVAASTVEIEYMRSKTTHTYKIDDITSIKVNNNTGKLADLKVGMEVVDSIERDDKTLDSISVGPARSAPAAPKKK